MKKAFCILLLSVFSLHAFYSAGVVTWFHLNKTYIISVLCENRNVPEKKCAGNCVLTKKAKQEKENTARTMQWVEISPCFISESTILHSQTFEITTYKIFTENNYHFSPVYSIFRPPLA